jgi:hypothetical protein
MKSKTPGTAVVNKEKFISLLEMAARVKTTRTELVRMVFERIIPPILDDSNDFVVEEKLEAKIRKSLN